MMANTQLGLPGIAPARTEDTLCLAALCPTCNGRRWLYFNPDLDSDQIERFYASVPDRWAIQQGDWATISALPVCVGGCELLGRTE